MCLRCEPRRKLSSEEEWQAYLYKALYAGRGMGKNYAAASKLRERVAINSLDNGRLGVGTLKAVPPTKLPPKICNYRKPKLYWFGTETPKYSLGIGASHWAVTRGMATHLALERFFAELNSVGDTVEEYKTKRFIGISEPTEIEKMDSDFLMKFTGDDWVETRTSNVSSKSWVPQGKIFVMSGKPLKINDKSKETIERVQDITFP